MNTEFRPFIYGLVDPIEPGHVRYVGMAMQSGRPYEHARAARRTKHHSHLYNWIRTLHCEDREPQVLILEELEVGQTRKEVGLVEQIYIPGMRAFGHVLTNVAEGGYGGSTFKGRKHTPATKKKMSLASLGKPASEATKARMKAAWKLRRLKPNPNIGQKRSKESRARQSIALKGSIPWNKGLKGVQVWSEASRQKASDTHKANNLLSTKEQKAAKVKAAWVQRKLIAARKELADALAARAALEEQS